MPNQPNFPIPSVINPENTRCIQLQIPDNDDWMRVFVGLLAQPSYWFNWQRTGNNQGAQCAAVWNELFVDIDWSTMSCCCDNPPAIYRYNSDGVYQRSTDGGTTWVDAPAYDYRNTSTEFPPPSALGISTTKCQNADSATVVLNEDVIQGLDNGAAIQAVIEFIAAVLIFYLSAGTLATVAIGIAAMAAAIIGYGVSSTKAAFTSDVINQLRCSIYNAMSSDDEIDAAGIATLLTDINDHYTGIIKTSLYAIISAAGPIGITNMIRSNRGASDADCSACAPPDCVNEWNLFNNDGSHGVLVYDETAGTITGTSYFDGTHHIFNMQTGDGTDNTLCCDMSAMSFVGGGSISYGWYACGSDSFSSGLPGFNCIYVVELVATASFVVTFTPVGC